MSHKLMIRFEIIAVASALLLASCAKEGGNGADAVLSFSTDSPGIVEVKAEAVTSVSDFYTKGYAGTTQWFPDPSTSTDPVKVVIPGTATFSDYKWIYGDSKIFYAYSNNLPTSGATAAIANNGVTLTYTAIPADATNQTDVTLGRYSGNGDNKGEAALTFYHPLAQVVFKMGDMAGVSSLNKIEIKGVYNAGTTTLNTSTGTTSVTQASGSGTASIANFSWTNISGSATVFQTITGALPSKDSEIGVPFMLIPQNLATQNVTVSVTVTTTGGSSVTLTKKLTSGSFVTGKKTVCTLTVNPNRQLDCTLTVYGEDTEDDIFKTGPDPNYWVDLGMVSDTGHRLYMSKYNVKKENGQYVFDTEGDGDDFTWAEANAITSANGVPCRLPTPCEWANLFAYSRDQSENPNVSWAYNVEDKLCTCTSKITGKSVTFPAPYGGTFNMMHYYSSVDGIKVLFSNISNRFTMGNNSNASSEISRTRVIYEDTSVSYTICSDPAPYVEVHRNLTSFKYYEGSSSASNPVTLYAYDELCAFYTLNNNFTASNVIFNTNNISLNKNFQLISDNYIWLVSNFGVTETVNMNFLGQYVLTLYVTFDK